MGSKPGIPPTVELGGARTARVRPRTLPMNPASGQYQCPVCKIEFPKANSLKFHYDSHHAVANPDLVTVPTYSCNACGQHWRNAKMKQEHDCPPAQSAHPDLHLRGKLVLNVMSWSQGQTYNGMKYCVEDPGMPIGRVKNLIECLVAVFPRVHHEARCTA